jgi:hypothetical protein
MVGYEVEDKLLKLLKDNWVKANTDGLTPKFLLVVDAKKYDFNTNKAVILFHTPTYRFEKNGCEKFTKRLNHLVRLDLRVLGSDQKSHFIKVYKEIIRILDVFLVNPFDEIQELDYEDEHQTDLSDKNKGLFRILLPVKLKNYSVTR